VATLNKNIDEYKKQIEKGDIKKAYQGLMEYLMGLRTYLKKTYLNHSVSGLYQGYMDMSYFTFTPETLKSRKLKVALIFVHDEARFEVWLVGFNKQVQKEYWEVFKQCNCCEYRVPETTKGVLSIAEHILTDNPDFDDSDTLTTQIERGMLRFIERIEHILAHCID
jgi:hypothetical protein